MIKLGVWLEREASSFAKKLDVLIGLELAAELKALGSDGKGHVYVQAQEHGGVGELSLVIRTGGAGSSAVRWGYRVK